MASEPPEEAYWDQEAVKGIDSLFTNRAFVQHLGEGMLRINFGVILTDPMEPKYHASIAVSASNAMAIAQLIYQMAQAALPPPPPPPPAPPAPPQAPAAPPPASSAFGVPPPPPQSTGG